MRGSLLALCVLVLAASASLAGGDEESDRSANFRRNAEKALCESACDDAKTALSSAKAKCKTAATNCSIAKDAEQKACVSREDVQTARDIAECTRTDPIPECYAGARSAGAARVDACKAATYNPSECGDVASACSGVDSAQSAKDAACRC